MISGGAMTFGTGISQLSVVTRLRMSTLPCGSLMFSSNMFSARWASAKVSMSANRKMVSKSAATNGLSISNL